MLLGWSGKICPLPLSSRCLWSPRDHIPRICNTKLSLKIRAKISQSFDIRHQLNFDNDEKTNVLRQLVLFSFIRHYGVLLLYGQHLAINHLVAKKEIRIFIASDMLDQSSTNSNPAYIKQGIRLNLHCWHTDNRFSKFAFKLGHYKQSELETYRNDTTAQAYVSKKKKDFWLIG